MFWFTELLVYGIAGLRNGWISGGKPGLPDGVIVTVTATQNLSFFQKLLQNVSLGEVFSGDRGSGEQTYEARMEKLVNSGEVLFLKTRR